MNKTKKSRIKNGAVQYLKKHRFSFLLKKENQVQFKNNAILGYIWKNQVLPISLTDKSMKFNKKIKCLIFI